MLEDRPEFLRRAKKHLNTACEIGENIRKLRREMPQDRLARLRQLKAVANMQNMRVNYLELAASYLYKDQ
jgi:hypothetical protein